MINPLLYFVLVVGCICLFVCQFFIHSAQFATLFNNVLNFALASSGFITNSQGSNTPTSFSITITTNFKTQAVFVITTNSIFVLNRISFLKSPPCNKALKFSALRTLSQQRIRCCPSLLTIVKTLKEN